MFCVFMCSCAVFMCCCCIITYTAVSGSLPTHEHHSCSTVVDGDRVMLLPGGHWCMVRDGEEGLHVEAGVVCGEGARVVGRVSYDAHGALKQAFVGRDVVL